MSGNKRINIATALNSKYMRYAYVMLTSLFDSQPQDIEDIHVYLLHSDLTDSDQRCLEELSHRKGGSIHWLFVDRKLFAGELPTNTRWTLEIYYRLLLADILPVEVSRLLYLDVDVIVNGSLKELFFSDLEGNVISACKDSAKLPFPAERAELFEDQIRNGFTYFNSGVLLMDIAALRKKYCFKYYMEVLNELLPKMWAPDQDLLNYIHWNEAKILDGRYNVYAKPAYNQGIRYEEVKRTAAIVHFTAQKPWEGEYVHYDIERLWWDYAQRTPFYHEFLEEFVYASIMNPMVYETMQKMSEEKQELCEELKKSAALCQTLSQMLHM